jgi:hypothetical protein
LPIATWIGNPTTMRNGNGDSMKARSIDQSPSGITREFAAALTLTGESERLNRDRGRAGRATTTGRGGVCQLHDIPTAADSP